MLSAIILEDDADSAELLIKQLKENCPHVHILDAVDTVAAAYACIQSQHPDLVFLDIELKGETSFELLQMFNPINFDIIFTTGYQDYMLRAIRLSAVDYLLKPVNIDDLKAAVNKAEHRKNAAMLNRSIEALMHNLKGNNVDQKIAVSATDGFILVKVSDIIYLESEGAYTLFHMKDNKKLTTSKNIKEYEELLTSHNFFRIHKSYIVNIAEINKYVRGDGGAVVMSNNVELDVSRRRKDDFLEHLHRA